VRQARDLLVAHPHCITWFFSVPGMHSVQYRGAKVKKLKG